MGKTMFILTKPISEINTGHSSKI